MAKMGLINPKHMESRGLKEVDGLDVTTTDSVLAANDCDNEFGEPNNSPPAPYGAGSVMGGPNSGMKGK